MLIPRGEATRAFSNFVGKVYDYCVMSNLANQISVNVEKQTDFSIQMSF